MALEDLRSRLAAYLACHVPEPAARSLGPLQELRGGWASSVYSVRLPRTAAGRADCDTAVLKLYGPDGEGRRHAVREWRALTHLRSRGVLVPGVIAFEPDARHLGRPFVVMEHVAGTALWSAFEAADPAGRGRLTRSFTERLVALHALDPRDLDPAGPVDPYGWIDRELARLRRDGEASAHTPLVQVVRWLQERRDAVPCERPVILHRDYHPWNVLLDADERLWVLDWDWQIGDPRFDLAWTCTLMERSGHHAFSTAVRAEYERLGESPLDELTWFEVLTTLRWLLNVLPAIGPHSRLGAEAREDFRAFLVEPLRRAQTLLETRTGTAVTLRV